MITETLTISKLTKLIKIRKIQIRSFKETISKAVILDNLRISDIIPNNCPSDLDRQ